MNLEPYMEGRYQKLTNNAKHYTSEERVQHGLHVATAFSHFSYSHSNGEVMVVDLQVSSPGPPPSPIPDPLNVVARCHDLKLLFE
jgi:hypothetical protein